MAESDTMTLIEVNLEKVEKELLLVSTSIKSMLKELAQSMVDARFNAALGEHVPLDAEGQIDALAINFFIWALTLATSPKTLINNLEKGDEKKRADKESVDYLKNFINTASTQQLYKLIEEVGHRPLQEVATKRRRKLVGGVIVG